MWFWLVAILVMAIPLINLVMSIVWAFAGENQTRKNYFRAMLVVLVLWTGLVLVLMAAGLLPGLARWF
jgi:hypothetical protein